MKGQVSMFIIMGLIVLIAAVMISYLEKPKVSVSVIPLGKNCADGTITGDCSAAKSLYCDSGKLVNDCRSCGCEKGFVCDKNSECAQEKPEQSKFTILFVPINYGSNDPEFLIRVKELSGMMKLVGINDFEVVDDTFSYPTSKCDSILPSLHLFAIKYLQKTAQKMKQAKASDVPIYPYRVIGIDRNIQDERLCGCAFTQVFNPTVYVGGSECSLAPHTAIHELGHTFGLCDEYDTCTWDMTSNYLYETYARTCSNIKPNNANSDCGNKCCKEDRACCLGKYAFGTSAMYNVMGSADQPGKRAIGTETDALLRNFLCAKLEVC